jgi:diguanylate cyclase (GGDEF)-like protein
MVGNRAMEPTVLKRATHKSATSARKDRRLRVVYRRELQNSVYYWALAAAAVAATAAIIGVLTTPGVTPLVLALLLPLTAAGLVAAREVRRRARRYVIQLGAAVGLIPVATAAISIVLMPRFESISLGTLGLIPLAFTIVIPLDRRPYLVWIGLADLIFAAVVGGKLLTGGDGDYAMAMLVAGAVATVGGIAANEAQLRRRRQMDGQLLAVRGLYARMKEHELDLRRQDEFLFMQQETLVVQQAELLRLNEELETIARLDALTGLGNRLRLNEDLAQLAARVERNGGTAGILLMDLDRFKRLNDLAGHLAGDAALRGVADVLRNTSRLGDGVYRYGGEEFLILLHDCDESALKAAGRRYISAIAGAGLFHPDNPPYGVVTASAGASELSQDNCTDVDAALHDADEALYVAKARGRNRLETHIRPGRAEIYPIGRKRAAG